MSRATVRRRAPLPAASIVVTAALLLLLAGCDADGPVREDFSYRLTVVVEGTYTDATVQWAGPAPPDPITPLSETGSGVFIFEDTPDYSADPLVLEIHITGNLAAGDSFTVSVSYSELGVIPATTRTIYQARRDGDDNSVEHEIRKFLSVPH
ncbi:MAG: hypothetical protein EA404_06585 [Spirochaetaceae bacterium]|nr:MAG: hypothetical protein EA404_06585 [Spirochaetaceae bacterium]